eukprot:366260-Chlamydomonas_euryale.AAC.27
MPTSSARPRTRPSSCTCTPETKYFQHAVSSPGSCGTRNLAKKMTVCIKSFKTCARTGAAAQHVSAGKTDGSRLVACSVWLLTHSAACQTPSSFVPHVV